MPTSLRPSTTVARRPRILRRLPGNEYAALRQLPAGGDRGGFFLILAAILVAGVRDTAAPETMAHRA